ncbi:hypothetical protein J6590_086038 [Homalodisca vitripennis]|nr:hypothetical protein J6590_086038 [Homalodisca vitripennis]
MLVQAGSAKHVTVREARKVNRPATIIVQFARRKIRDRLLEARKTVVTNAETTGLKGGRIFVGENLSFYYRNLLKRAKLKARGLDYQFVWYRNGLVRVKKAPDSRVILIEKEDDLELIK